MRRILGRIVKGMKHSEKYGYHPGTPVLAMFTLVGLISGGLQGGLLMFVLVAPLYLLSCYDRGD